MSDLASDINCLTNAAILFLKRRQPPAKNFDGKKTKESTKQNNNIIKYYFHIYARNQYISPGVNHEKQDGGN